MRFYRGIVGLMLLCFGAAAMAEGPRIAIVMDDLGYQEFLDQAIMGLDRRVVVAIIPEAPAAKRLARQARYQQREVLVHLPLAGMYQDNCEPALTCMGLDWPAEKVTEHLTRALARVEGAVGINNHQGSRFSRDRRAVAGLIHGLKEINETGQHNLFVLDSRTAPDTVLEREALDAGLAATRRHVFLDHYVDPVQIEQAWNQLLAMARSRGSAVAIGHPHRETIAFLKEALPQLEEQGIELVPVSSLTRRRSLVTGLDEPAYPASR